MSGKSTCPCLPVYSRLINQTIWVLHAELVRKASVLGWYVFLVCDWVSLVVGVQRAELRCWVKSNQSHTHKSDSVVDPFQLRNTSDSLDEDSNVPVVWLQPGAQREGVLLAGLPRIIFVAVRKLAVIATVVINSLKSAGSRWTRRPWGDFWRRVLIWVGLLGLLQGRLGCFGVVRHRQSRLCASRRGFVTGCGTGPAALSL